ARKASRATLPSTRIALLTWPSLLAAHLQRARQRLRTRLVEIALLFIDHVDHQCIASRLEKGGDGQRQLDGLSGLNHRPEQARLAHRDGLPAGTAQDVLGMDAGVRAGAEPP